MWVARAPAGIPCCQAVPPRPRSDGWQGGLTNKKRKAQATSPVTHKKLYHQARGIWVTPWCLDKNSVVEAAFCHGVLAQIPEYHLDIVELMTSLPIRCQQRGLGLPLSSGNNQGPDHIFFHGLVIHCHVFFCARVPKLLGWSPRRTPSPNETLQVTL